jgi:hypothetical protein
MPDIASRPEAFRSWNGVSLYEHSAVFQSLRAALPGARANSPTRTPKAEHLYLPLADENGFRAL